MYLPEGIFGNGLIVYIYIYIYYVFILHIDIYIYIYITIYIYHFPGSYHWNKLDLDGMNPNLLG